MVERKFYILKKDLPFCEAGTIFLHEIDRQPSRYHEGTYEASNEWYEIRYGNKFQTMYRSVLMHMEATFAWSDNDVSGEKSQARSYIEETEPVKIK